MCPQKGHVNALSSSSCGPQGAATTLVLQRYQNLQIIHCTLRPDLSHCPLSSRATHTSSKARAVSCWMPANELRHNFSRDLPQSLQCSPGQRRSGSRALHPLRTVLKSRFMEPSKHRSLRSRCSDSSCRFRFVFATSAERWFGRGSEHFHLCRSSPKQVHLQQISGAGARTSSSDRSGSLPSPAAATACNRPPRPCLV